MKRQQPKKHVVRRGPARRDFLKMAGGCAALTNTSLWSTIFNLSATNSVMAGNIGGINDYKAIVCLFQFGGNDSFNMLSPLEADQRADYELARGGVYDGSNGALGLPIPEDVTPHQITDPGTGYKYMVHPAMPEMKTLYDQGDLGFIANIGSLVEPTTMAQFQQASNLPLGLFSHADLQRHWMTSVPNTRSQVTGWAGRMADCMTDSANQNDAISMNIALNNVNLWQTGGGVIPYIVTSEGASEVGWYGQTWTEARIFTQMTDDALNRSYSNLFVDTFARSNRNALDAAIEYNAATTGVTLATTFPDEDLANQLKMVAQTIAARDTLTQKRQIFFVSQGGYDNHDELINNQTGTLGAVSRALKAFYDSLVEMNVQDNVLTFTASDFARTLNSNGQGSDHAWGGNHIVMGGAVDGGKVHGTYPTSLAPGNELDLGRGRLLPTTSVDEMAAEMAMWYGIPNDNTLTQVLPNAGNFPNIAASNRPIGFINS